MSVVEKPVEERIEGGRPGRLRAVLAAVAVGAAAVAAAYKLLRSGSDSEASHDE